MGETNTDRCGATAPPETKASGASRNPAPPNDVSTGLYQKGYVLEKTLGSGAYAKVKQAHAVSLNKKVAIKIVDKKKAPNDVLSKFLPREQQALTEMSSHDNIISIHDVIVTTDKYCFIMELAENGDLLDYINAKKRLSERTARSFFRDLVTGIAACHQKNIVHRDIKCENLLLDANYRLKISDFGFARTCEPTQHLDTFCGSFAYAAPEIILGEPYVGTCSDVWSMGIVLYAMVCGKLPFKDTNVKTLLSQISNGLSFSRDVSESCKDLLRKLLVFSSKERLTAEKILSQPWMRQDPEH